MTKPKGLVIDDDSLILESVDDILSILNHEKSDGAQSADEARSLLEKNKYDYVILDLEIPTRFGTKADVRFGQMFLNEIRKLYSKDELPVIIITGRLVSRAEYAADIMFAGANDYITKPFPQTGHTLEAAVEKVLAESKRAKESGIVAPPSGAAWITRKYSPTTTSWTITAMNGKTYEIHLRSKSKQNLVLECIFRHYREKKCIPHGDFVDQCGWTDREYFKKENGKLNPKRGVIKNHLSEIRSSLHMDYEFIDIGIIFNQPEA